MKASYTGVKRDLKDVTVIEKEDRAYPEMLRQTGRSAPDRLYCLGDVSLLNMESAAVVGARRATPYGKWAAYNTARKLAEHDIVVVSGMAYGCDSRAHRGALDAGGKTIAVLGSGVLVCYPASNRGLYEEIISKGLVISEFPPHETPRRAYFAERNRIISGLSRTVVVAEAGLKSGALITADHAGDQGRTVMAVPGNLTSVSSMGCNKLIQDGAEILVSFADALEEFDVDPEEYCEAGAEELAGPERIIYELVRNGGELSLGQLSEKTGMTLPEISEAAVKLEIKGFVTSSMGKVFIAN